MISADGGLAVLRRGCGFGSFFLTRGLLGFALFARRLLAVLERRGVFAFAEDHGDGRIDGHVGGAFGDQDLAQRALVHRLHFHSRLVGFDFRDDVA
jgi:hypothetical protein